jgi:hypothetical protein
MVPGLWVCYDNIAGVLFCGLPNGPQALYQGKVGGSSREDCGSSRWWASESKAAEKIDNLVRANAR